MSDKTNQIILEINTLSLPELEELQKEIIKKIIKLNKVKDAFAKIRGISRGVWNMDAQEYVNQSREGDRE